MGLSRMAAAVAAEREAALQTPPQVVIEPGGTFQVPLHMLESPGWQIIAEGIPTGSASSLSFAFLLGGAVLRAGRKEMELRRSLGLALETTCVAMEEVVSSQSSFFGSKRYGNLLTKRPHQRALQRYSLLLLPQLRVVNSLPITLHVAIDRWGLDSEDGKAEVYAVEPGSALDIGRLPFGCKLLLSGKSSSHGEGATVIVDPDSLKSRKQFRSLKHDRLSISDDMQCSLQCRWRAGAGPEFVVMGKCVLFNKTGLKLQVQDAANATPHSSSGATPTLTTGGVAVVPTQLEIRVGISKPNAERESWESATPPQLPAFSGLLRLRMRSGLQDSENAFEWKPLTATLDGGMLKLQHGNLPEVSWHLSEHTGARPMKSYLTGGQSHCFCLEDPARGQSLLLQADSTNGLHLWIQKLQDTISRLREKALLKELSAGWDAAAHGCCRIGDVPTRLQGAWCRESIPIQAPSDGEIAVEIGEQSPTVAFLGVQVRPVVGLVAQSQGVTVTPRFVVRNTSKSFLQILPGLLPDSSSDWPKVSKKNDELISRLSCGTQELTDFLADEEEFAVWIPPGESLALFHFPLRCRAQEAKNGDKAVAIRLPGRAPLQLLSVTHKCPLILDRVFTTGFMPYKDNSHQLGRMPQRLRVLAQEGRLLCLRGYYNRKLNLESLVLNVDAEVFLGLPPIEQEASSRLQASDWTLLHDDAELRLKGRSTSSLLIHRRAFKAGHFEIPSERSSVLFIARALGSCDEDETTAYMQQLGEETGLPWSPWLSLGATSENVVGLRCGGGVTGDGLSMEFIRCSVQCQSSTAFLILSDEPAPYRVENWSPSRTLTVNLQGSDICQVLPPLSWCAFDWPSQSMPLHRKKLVLVQDVATHCKELYDADDVSPCQPLNLNEGQEVTGRSAPLTEAGYHDVVLLQSDDATREFVERVARELNGHFKDANALVEFAKRYSGEDAILSLRQMRQEMIALGIAPAPKPVLTDTGCSAASLCTQTMFDFVKALLASGGLACKDEELLAYVSKLARLPSLQQQLDELPRMSWVEAKQPVDEAFAALLASPDLAPATAATVLHLCLRRELLRQKETTSGKLVSAKLQTTASRLAHEICSGQRLSWKDVLEEATKSDTCRSVSTMSASRPRSVTQGSARGEACEDSPAQLSEPEEQIEGGAPGSSTRAPASANATVGMSEPLSEEGYLTVASLGCDEAMAAFIRRILADEGGEVLDQRGLARFAKHWCARASALNVLEERTLVQLREELQREVRRNENWLRFGIAARGKLFVRRSFDGVSRVIAIREAHHDRVAGALERGRVSSDFDWWDLDIQLAGLHFCIIFQAKPHFLGTGTVLSDDKDEEQLAITLDHLQLSKSSGTNRVELKVHHFQVDNMRESDRLRPIILCPEDSGYYSDRREQRNKDDRNADMQMCKSFLYFCLEKVDSGILHFKELTFLLQPFIARFDVMFWMELGQRLMEWSSGNGEATSAAAGTSAEDLAIIRTQVEKRQVGGILVPSSASLSQPVFFETFRLGALITQLELLVPMKSKYLATSKANSKAGTGSDSMTGSSLDDDGEDDDWNSAQSEWLKQMLARWTHRSQGLMQKVLIFSEKLVILVAQSAGSCLASGLGHVTPRFSLTETVIQNEFTDLNPFIDSITREYVKQAVSKWWRVFLSVNMIGDPVGLGTSMAGGVWQFFRKTGSEIYTGDLRGEGLKSLAGVIGSPFAAAGKVFGALGDTFDAIGGTSQSQLLYEPGSVSHVGDGLAVGAQVFARGTASGIKGLVYQPVKGLQTQGIKGLGQGLLQGVSGLVAKPMSGLMHGVQHIAEGVDATTHLWDQSAQIVRRRMPRHLPGLKPLLGPEFSPEITIFVDRLRFLGSAPGERKLRGSTYRVGFFDESRGWSKATKLGHIDPDGSIAFNAAKWVPVQVLLDSDIVVEVQDQALADSPDTPDVIYRATIPRRPDPNRPEPALWQVARLLREPESLACPEGLAGERLRPSTSLHVELEGVGRARSQAVAAELLLSFWPAWNPTRVPSTQRWYPSKVQVASESSYSSPQRKEGWLEKRSKGAFHHWSAKWVVLHDNKFEYWDDKSDYERHRDPKVRYHLNDPRCQFRFAAGDAPETFFVQVRAADGLLEARWRPPQEADEQNAESWLQNVLRHSIRDSR
eukprot:TRINITY_DN38029_c0_g1_i1.p1 TRINITY_DN38029_c0_g1~~TRINITY_DN38029_c0_g1_i1.p1  ORF type:complete len:2442 (+),score=383.62 TRINITY_DN38029_c0_g1_i1:882-7328(+)